jgi:hypothetical protein
MIGAQRHRELIESYFRGAHRNDHTEGAQTDVLPLEYRGDDKGVRRRMEGVRGEEQARAALRRNQVSGPAINTSRTGSGPFSEALTRLRGRGYPFFCNICNMCNMGGPADNGAGLER